VPATPLGLDDEDYYGAEFPGWSHPIDVISGAAASELFFQNMVKVVAVTLSRLSGNGIS
jgi:hypothetical protein